jgi:creatinine amidohydrolase
VLGDPTGATSGEGAESVAVMVAGLVTAVRSWSVDEATGRLT